MNNLKSFLAKFVFALLLTISFGILINQNTVNADTSTKYLDKFDTQTYCEDLHQVEFSFVKVLNFKTNRSDITVNSLLKFVYPNKSDKELSTASASIKDGVRYAKSLGVEIEWTDSDSNGVDYDKIKTSIDKDNPVILVLKPKVENWTEPYIMIDALGYMFSLPDGKNPNIAPAKMIMSWCAKQGISIFLSNQMTPQSQDLQVMDFNNPGKNQRDCRLLGYLTIK